MKHLFSALLLALPLLAVPSQARANGSITFGGSITLFAKTDCGCCGGPGGGCAAPWYNYWPYADHFMAPAHPEYPFWPQAMNPVIPGGQLNAPPPAPHAGYYPGPNYYQPVSYPNYQYPNYQNTGFIQPVNYPSYWYGR